MVVAIRQIHGPVGNHSVKIRSERRAPGESRHLPSPAKYPLLVGVRRRIISNDGEQSIDGGDSREIASSVFKATFDWMDVSVDEAWREQPTCRVNNSGCRRGRVAQFIAADGNDMSVRYTYCG
jgi:hypothetical protein